MAPRLDAQVLKEGGMSKLTQEIAWGHEFEQALSEANGKLVLLDFSAAPM